MQPSLVQFRPVELLVISCDGSFRGNDDSGLGFTIASNEWPRLLYFCGPTVLSTDDDTFIGACRHSSNVGEISAMLLALLWGDDHLRSTLPASTSAEGSCSVVIEYDSEHAADVIRRRTRATSNLNLVLRARHVYDRVAHRLVWRKIPHEPVPQRARRFARQLWCDRHFLWPGGHSQTGPALVAELTNFEEDK